MTRSTQQNEGPRSSRRGMLKHTAVAVVAWRLSKAPRRSLRQPIIGQELSDQAVDRVLVPEALGHASSDQGRQAARLRQHELVAPVLPLLKQEACVQLAIDMAPILRSSRVQQRNIENVSPPPPATPSTPARSTDSERDRFHRARESMTTRPTVSRTNRSSDTPKRRRHLARDAQLAVTATQKASRHQDHRYCVDIIKRSARPTETAGIYHNHGRRHHQGPPAPRL
jgi:hypothetical protein